MSPRSKGHADGRAGATGSGGRPRAPACCSTSTPPGSSRQAADRTRACCCPWGTSHAWRPRDRRVEPAPVGTPGLGEVRSRVQGHTRASAFELGQCGHPYPRPALHHRLPMRSVAPGIFTVSIYYLHRDGRGARVQPGPVLTTWGASALPPAPAQPPLGWPLDSFSASREP